MPRAYLLTLTLTLTCVPAEQVVIEVDLGAGQVGEIEFGFYPNAAPATVLHSPS